MQDDATETSDGYCISLSQCNSVDIQAVDEVRLGLNKSIQSKKEAVVVGRADSQR